MYEYGKTEGQTHTLQYQATCGMYVVAVMGLTVVHTIMCIPHAEWDLLFSCCSEHPVLQPRTQVISSYCMSELGMSA